MKRFFVKLILIVVPFVLLLFVLNSAYKKSFYWKARREQSKFLYVPDNIQLANIGSSQGICSFNYEDISDYKCFNFAVTWQHNRYNYYVLKQYVNKFAPEAVLLIPISYFDITRIEKDVYERYYGILDRVNFPEWDFKEHLQREVFPFFSTKEVWKRLRMTEQNSPLLVPPRVPIPEEELQMQAQGTFFTWTEATEAEQGEKGFEYNIKMLSSIIELCREHKIIPVLVSTPQIDELNILYTQTDFFDTFYRFTDELKNKYPGLLYLDYSHNKEYSADSSLFGDVAHLNVYGAKEFTSQIVLDLKNAGLLR